MKDLVSVFDLSLPEMLVIVGSEKVPAEVYDLYNINVAVTSHPHSEAAGLAIFLDRISEGEWEDLPFEGGEIEIVPTGRGKEVRKK